MGYRLDVAAGCVLHIALVVGRLAVSVDLSVFNSLQRLYTLVAGRHSQIPALIRALHDSNWTAIPVTALLGILLVGLQG